MAANDEQYESAEYKVILSDGKFEVREYPDLMLAATRTGAGPGDSGGGFMQLFRYISGANASKQKISMTTPVFMERQASGSGAQMGFVMPKEVAAQGAPAPTGAEVEMRKRPGGRFAVVRFSGLMTANSVEDHAAQLRAWMQAKGLDSADAAGEGMETAAYDSPFTPPSRRRNEVQIRLRAGG
jgi:DNA gyrase inhibitor GyrI